MKRNILLVVVAVFVIGFTGCKKCRNEDPRARVLNNGSESVSVHIQTSVLLENNNTTFSENNNTTFSENKSTMFSENKNA